MGMWREQLADTPETGVQVQPAMNWGSRVTLMDTTYFSVMWMVKSSITSKHFLVSVQVVKRSGLVVNGWLTLCRLRFESPHTRLIRMTSFQTLCRFRCPAQNQGLRGTVMDTSYFSIMWMVKSSITSKHSLEASWWCSGQGWWLTVS